MDDIISNLVNKILLDAVHRSALSEVFFPGPPPEVDRIDRREGSSFLNNINDTLTSFFGKGSSLYYKIDDIWIETMSLPEETKIPLIHRMLSMARVPSSAKELAEGMIQYRVKRKTINIRLRYDPAAGYIRLNVIHDSNK